MHESVITTPPCCDGYPPRFWLQKAVYPGIIRALQALMGFVVGFLATVAVVTVWPYWETVPSSSEVPARAPESHQLTG